MKKQILTKSCVNLQKKSVENKNEVWKDIEGYSNYLISNTGKIKNKKTGRHLKPYKDKEGYLIVCLYKKGNGKIYRIHRLVCFTYLDNPENKLYVDHINHNITDNNLDNLRFCTRSENNKNRESAGTSKYLGVCWSKAAEKWQANIRINGKQKYLGCFSNEEAAAKEYDKFAINYHGEFANPNFK